MDTKPKENLVKILIDNHQISKGWLMDRLGCSWQSIENWYAGRTAPLRPYQVKLERLLEREQKRGETEVKD